MRILLKQWTLSEPNPEPEMLIPECKVEPRKLSQRLLKVQDQESRKIADDSCDNTDTTRTVEDSHVLELTPKAHPERSRPSVATGSPHTVGVHENEQQEDYLWGV